MTPILTIQIPVAAPRSLYLDETSVGLTVHLRLDALNLCRNFRTPQRRWRRIRTPKAYIVAAYR
jgi:hypothetical protein